MLTHTLSHSVRPAFHDALLVADIEGVLPVELRREVREIAHELVGDDLKISLEDMDEDARRLSGHLVEVEVGGAVVEVDISLEVSAARWQAVEAAVVKSLKLTAVAMEKTAIANIVAMSVRQTLSNDSASIRAVKHRIQHDLLIGLSESWD